MKKTPGSNSQKKEKRKADRKSVVDFDRLIDSLRKENEMLRNIASSLKNLEKNFSKSRKKK